MRKLLLSLSCLALFLLAGNASASCGSVSFYNYGGFTRYFLPNDLSTADTDDCWDKSGVTYTSMSCSFTGYGLIAYGSTLEYSFVVPSSSGSGTSFELDFDVDATSPSQHFYDSINAYVAVTHGGQTSWTTIYQHTGVQSDVNCGSPYGSFTAYEGDTVEIYFYGGSADSNPNDRVSYVRVYRYNS